MTKKKTITFGLVGLLGVAAAVGASQLGSSSNLRATEVNTWKHFAAVMPTDTTKGIREYWTDCVSQGPLFSAPEGITAQDATLTDAQIATILADEDDTRIIPTLSEIKRSVAKDYDGKSATQGYDVATAYNYVYLDDATKALVTGADETKIKAAYDAYNGRFAIVDTAIKMGVQFSFTNGVCQETYADGYGLVNELVSGATSNGWASFAYSDANLDLSDYDYFLIYVYNPTDSAWTDVRIMNDGWKDESKKAISVAAHSWGEFKIEKSWFDTYTSSKFSGWWLGIVNYTGYESATETFKISKPIAHKSAASALDFDEIVGKISSISNPTQGDAYYIYKASKLLEGLNETMKSKCTKLADYNTAKANCTYGLAATVDASTFSITTGWIATAEVADVADDTVGHVMKITSTANGGAMESTLDVVTLDSTVYDTVSFSIRTEFRTKFTLSKSSWWNNAYDFNAKSWVSSGDNITYWIDPSADWTTLTMPVADFNECKYFSYLNSSDSSVVGKNFYISSIYAHKISA